MTETTRIKRIFRGAIQRGTGRAHLMMRDYPHINFSQEILKAAVTNYAYDPQCERSRGLYTVELINLSAQREKLTRQVLQKLVEQKDNTWGLDQLFEIARLLAQAGNQEARVAFYERLELGASPGYACVGMYEAVKLDGVEGMKRAAAVIGKFLAANPEETEHEWLLNYAQEHNPEVRVEEELAKAAQHNTHIAYYLTAVQATRQREAEMPPRPAAPGFEFIRNNIENRTRKHLSASIVEKLNRQQIRLLADAFLLETNRHRQEGYLLVFRHVKFPYGYEKLLALAQAPVRRTDRLVEHAVAALRFFKAPPIREFALTALTTSKEPWLYLDLLINHYRRGDHVLLTTLARQADSELAIENLASSFIRIYQKHKTKESQEPLRKIYHRMNCGMHRADVVETMIRNGVLPDKIREEIPFDSYYAVREAHASLAAATSRM
ncbi:hypothetical protein J0X19_19305 [Hymenobacter sp. BT186]|uniref:Uncharacterized protein n=1 Tax=Hymenobacter telluris TaxID=2816474 RepID=A0A939JF71_9BACT|nr:hypothetical protein [Hymenobacter telluris]MBO0360117.1 hypothetical protein [Hymenobacter telluris]MBW3376144.1 hypothetical protein [Hymenobacter norwichensis]